MMILLMILMKKMMMVKTLYVCDATSINTPTRLNRPDMAKEVKTTTLSENPEVWNLEGQFKSTDIVSKKKHKKI